MKLSLFVALGMGALAGCAARPVPAPPADHPANAAAAPGPSTRAITLDSAEPASPTTRENQPAGGHHHGH